MKTILLFLLLFTATLSNAQNTCTVSITGDTCINGVLYASSSQVPDTLLWFKNNIPVQLSTQTGFDSAGIQVTGVRTLYPPRDVFVDNAGNIYVADDSHCLVKEWKVGASAYVTVAGNGYCMLDPHSLNGPESIVVDSAGFIYVAEDYSGQGQVSKWSPVDTGGVVVAKNGLHSANAVALDKNYNLFVCDNATQAVFEYPPNSNAQTIGKIVAGGNGRGSALNQLSSPSSIVVDDSDNVYVSDYYNYRVVKWKPGATEGIVVAGGNGGGPSIRSISYSGDIQVDDKKNVYIADYNKVILWPPGSPYGITVAQAHYHADSIYFGGSIFLDKSLNLYEGNYNVIKYPYIHHIDNSTRPSVVGVTMDTFRVKASFENGCNAISKPQTVNEKPSQLTINGQTGGLCGTDNFTYSASANRAQAYEWENPPRTLIVNGKYRDSMLLAVTDSFSQGPLYLKAYNTCGYTQKKFVLNSRPSNVKIIGPGVTSGGKVLSYHADPAEENVVYTWTVSDGIELLQGQGTNSIKVKWGYSNGYLSVISMNKCGEAKKVANKQVTILNSINQLSVDAAGIEKTNLNALLIYPQPVRNNFTLRFLAQQAATYKIVITGITGNVLNEYSVVAVSGINTQKIDISNFAAGTYFLTLQCKDVKAMHLKILKQ